jgi:RHS repeat-associated protein
MRIVSIFILCLFCTKLFSQNVEGPQIVQPGSTATYSLNWGSTPPMQNIIWGIDGGDIIGGGDLGIEVRWYSHQSNYNGTITYFDADGNFLGDFVVLVGQPFLTPSNQIISYGATNVDICLNTGWLTPTNIVWQQSPNNDSWVDIVDPNVCHHVPVIEQPVYYRCVFELGGETFYTDYAYVEVAQLKAGTISLNGQPAYNNHAVINSTPATGGYCYASNYQYVWEQSVEGNPWQVIGNGQAYPANAPPITGHTSVRRSITCSGERLYSNTIEFDPAYTGIDYENRNYIRANTISTRGIQSWYQADQLAPGKKFQETVYLDGLGRQIQTVSKGTSPAPNNVWKDMVSFTDYDNQGRPVRNNLPYPTASDPGKFKTNTGEQANFFAANYNESSPWGKNVYENNPLNRIEKTIDPGAYRINNGIGISFDFDFNNSNNVDEKVHIWRIGYNPGDIPVSSATDLYQKGTLVKSILTDDKGKKVIEYKDLKGNAILKKVQLQEAGAGLTDEHDGWLCTYYVYDDFNQLRFTITPKAVAYLNTHSWDLTQEIADELCFSYEYDERGRMTGKKSAGVDKLNMVYDQRDRLILTQDGNQLNKSTPEWLVNFYDDQDRPVESGIFKSALTRDQLQADVNTAGVASSTTVSGGTSLPPILEVYTRPSINPPPRYVASQEIIFYPGFESYTGDAFVAEIESAPSGIGTNINVVLVAQPPVNVNSTAYTALTYKYYDDHNYVNAKPFNNNYTNTQAYSSADPDIEPIIVTKRLRGMATGSKVRVLNTNTFLVTSIYYDEIGEVIQTLSDNYKNGTDVVTLQHHFDGRIMSSYSQHGLPGGAFDGFGVLTKNIYDKVGHLVSLEKKFGNTNFKKIADYEYDEFGRVKTKRLGQKPNTTDPLETLAYSYNVNGLLTGINKDYALSQNNFDQWNNYFGLYLGYENYDNQFANARFDHLITGVIWKTQGDNTPRKYDFTYDNAGRYTAANFTQKTAPSATGWSNATVDLSESDIEYDENGNLKKLYRKGIVAGNAASVYVDKLTYHYKPKAGGEWSNQLLKVFDNNPSLSATTNGKLGDFKDEVYNSNTDDYAYDRNGNLEIDNNKKIRNGSAAGITYNYLDKPEKIILENKSTVEFTYDAVGNKLAKRVTPASGSAKTTYYMGEYIYEDNDLQYIIHEEGRLRVMTKVSSTSSLGAAGQIITGNIQLLSNKWGAFDYFIKDHLGSTRMVLTEEYHKEIFKCTMEDAAGAEEVAIFGKVDNNGNAAPGNEVIETRRDNIGWASNSSLKVSRLVTTGTPGTTSVGPNTLLKVMAGDVVNAYTKYFYEMPPVSTQITSNGILSSIVSSLIGGLTGSGVSQAVKDGAGSLEASLQDVNASPLVPYLNNRPDQQADRPKAYLNYIFFDENFNYVENESGAVPVDKDFNDYSLTSQELRAPKNGYVYVYLSNESNWPVQFDEFTVSHERSAIIEETHYYPYGMKIAGISARAFNKLPNKYKFQGDYSEEEEESGYDEFDLRMYDPQIGRWIQHDPYNQYSSGYIAMGNDPVNNIDPDGGFIEGAAPIIGASIGAVVGAAAGYFIDKANGGSGQVGAASGFLLGGGMGYFLAGINYYAMIQNIGSFFGGIRFSGLDNAVSTVTRTATGMAPLVSRLLIVETRVIINGQVTYEPVNDSYYGTIQTGSQVMGGDISAGFQITRIEYGGYTAYGGFNRVEKTQIIPPAGPPKLPSAENPNIQIPKFDGNQQFGPLGPVPIATENLQLDFLQNTSQLDPNVPGNIADANRQIGALARRLQRNPNLNVTFTGNSGLGNPNGAPVSILGGNALNALGSQRRALLQGLMQARANTIANMLTRLGVSPERITTNVGNIYNDPSGRFVGVQVQ